jgi:deoxyadenosine/deoxycytidine kinase
MKISSLVIVNVAILGDPEYRVRKLINYVSKKIHCFPRMVGDPEFEFDIDQSTLGGQKFKVVVEGNIASGKSTLLNHFSKTSYSQVMFEPVEEWQAIGGGNLLGRMYDNKERWGYTFQSYVLLTMMKLHDKEQELPISVLERSAFSARYCFVKNLHNGGAIDDLEYSCYLKWFDYVMTKPPQIDLIVYLRTTPEVCFQRLRERQRGEETGVSLDYLESLHDRYEEWLAIPEHHSWHGGRPVLILDCDRDYRDEAGLFDQMRDKIVHKLLHPGSCSQRLTSICQSLTPTTTSTPPAVSYKAKRNLYL